jgi:small subunit ribosomal protein S2
MARSRGGDVKPEAGAVAGDEPLAEWERELLEGQAADVPAARGAADEATGAETSADEAIGVLQEPLATDATTPDGVPAVEALDADQVADQQA